MNTLAEERGTTLLAVARDAIAERLGEAGIGQGTHASWLQEPGASFQIREKPRLGRKVVH